MNHERHGTGATGASGSVATGVGDTVVRPANILVVGKGMVEYIRTALRTHIVEHLEVAFLVVLGVLLLLDGLFGISRVLPDGLFHRFLGVMLLVGGVVAHWHRTNTGDR